MKGHSSNIYGEDRTATAERISNRFLGNPRPTLDVHGDKDTRSTAEPKGNMEGGEQD